MLKSIFWELLRKNSGLSQIIYKHEIQTVAYPRELKYALVHKIVIPFEN